MWWLKLGGIGAAAIALFFVLSWASKTIREGVEAENLRAQLATAKAAEDIDAAAYQEGLNDGAAQAKIVERVKVIYKKVPTHVQKADACAVDPDAVRMRNSARTAARLQALQAADAPDAVAPGNVGPGPEPHP